MIRNQVDSQEDLGASEGGGTVVSEEIDVDVAVGFTAKFHQQCPCGSIFVAAVIGCDNHYTDGIVVFRIQSAQVITDQGTVLPVVAWICTEGVLDQCGEALVVKTLGSFVHIVIQGGEDDCSRCGPVVRTEADVVWTETQSELTSTAVVVAEGHGDRIQRLSLEPDAEVSGGTGFTGTVVAIGEQHTGCVIVGGKDGEVVNLSTRGIQIDLRLGNIVIKHARGIIIIDAGKPDGETLVIRSQFAFIHRVVVIGKRVNDHCLGGTPVV